MRIKTIFLDLDDVLNRFTMHALRRAGCDVNTHDDTSYNPEWGWDIVKAANSLPFIRRGRRDKWGIFSKGEFWSCIGREVWANTPVSGECRFLIDECREMVGPRNVFILSTPTEDPECLAGKLEWIHKFTPSWLHRQYVLTPCKALCARPDALLIDDSDANVGSFRSAGGQAILVPRPWNIYHKLNAMEYLQKVFQITERSQK